MTSKVLLKGNPIELIGQTVKVGNTLANYSFVDQNLKTCSLNDFKGKKVLSIFPSIDTGVCLLSTKKINEEAQKKQNVSFLMISCDLPFAFKRICQQEKIQNVTTLSLMQSKEFLKDLGLLMNSGPLKGLAARAIIVVSENNKVKYLEIVQDITFEPNYENAYKALGNTL